MWAKNESSEDEMLQVVDAGIADIPPEVVTPVLTHEPPYVLNNTSYLHLVTPFPFKVAYLCCFVYSLCAGLWLSL